MSALRESEPDIHEPALQALPDAAETLAAGTLISGRYRIDAVIGRGGMATVYQGHDERLRRDVAIKVCTRPVDTPAPPLQEEQVSSRLIHPNIVAVFDAGTIADGEAGGGSTFIVMEYVHGTTTHEMAPVPWRQAVDIVCQAAAGLAAAHQLGVVHCDVTPSNVLVDGNGRVLLADFGVAVETDSAADDFVHGSPAYMAPERVQGAKADARVDVYGLGGVFAYLLTARHPQADGALELPDNCPTVIKEIIQRARAKNPQARYADARELEAALAAAPELVTSGNGRQMQMSADAITRHVPVERSTPLPAAQVTRKGSASHGVSNAEVLRGNERQAATAVAPVRAGWRGVSRARVMAAALVAAVVLALLFADAIFNDANPGPIAPQGVAGGVEMPDVSGMKFADAIAQLAEQGIVVERVDVIYGPGPLNQVVAQEPASGQAVSDGQDVTLVVRTGR